MLGFVDYLGSMYGVFAGFCVFAFPFRFCGYFVYILYSPSLIDNAFCFSIKTHP